jgi:GDP-L-fucose synthase
MLERYQKEAVPALKKVFNYRNVMQIPRIEKIVVNIGVGHDLSIRELAETVREVVGYQGALEFDATKPDGTPRKLMDVGRLNTMGWKAGTAMQVGLAYAYKDFLAVNS